MNLLLMGPPGAGKGVQAELIAKAYGLIHISSGDLFREAIRNKSNLGRQVKKYIERGELVPDEVVNQEIFNRLSKSDCNLQGFLLDGYPRTIPQAKALTKFLDRTNNKLSTVILLKVAKKELIRRLSGRLICPKCNRIYQKETMPPKVNNKCDACSSTLIQREDDKPQQVAHRLAVYIKQTKPIIDYYRAMGLLVSIRACETPERTFEKINKRLKQLIKLGKLVA